MPLAEASLMSALQALRGEGTPPAARHPRLDEAMLAAAAALVGLYRGNWVLNRIANDQGRVIGAMMMLDLHFGRGCQGFTVAELRAEAQRDGVASPNRMTAFAGLLRASGYLALIPGLDARKRKLAPTKALLDLHRRRMAALMAGTVILHPDLAAAGLAALDQDEKLAEMDRAFLGRWRAAGGIAACCPTLEGFVERDAGFTLLCLLLCGEAKGQSFRISELSRFFAISRTHALVIMREAMSHGLVEREAAGGAYRGTAALRAVMRLVFLHLCAIQAEVVGEVFGTA
ncbi:hypothetical protein AcidC75_03530 [Acidisoma sp. C75]